MAKLDISYIIKKLIEIEKLKLILLTPDQVKMFDYLPKPTIPQNLKLNDDQEINYIFFSDDIPFKMRIQKALTAYKNTRNNSDYIS
jgi:hypothetical protein